MIFMGVSVHSLYRRATYSTSTFFWCDVRLTFRKYGIIIGVTYMATGCIQKLERILNMSQSELPGSPRVESSKARRGPRAWTTRSSVQIPFPERGV